MPVIGRKMLGDMLLEDGLITPEQLNEALGRQQQSTERRPIGELLIQLGYLSEEELALTLSKKLRTRYVSFSDNSLVLQQGQNLEKLIDEKFARRNFVLPLSKTATVVTITMWDPLDLIVIDNVRRATSLNPTVYCSPKKDIIAGLERLYGYQSGSAVSTQVRIPFAEGSEAVSASHEDMDKIKTMAADSSVIKVVNRILQEAVSQRASDIHIEPLETGISVRYRIDGILYETESPSKDMLSAIVSRIKILSRIDIAEKRLPQDGGFMLTVAGQSVDFRVSTIPTIYGEKIAIRVLDKEKIRLNLASIGLSDGDSKKVLAHIRKPYGLIFVTGPTGSGKTTSLYCILNELRSPHKNIITIEDPVEYRIPGINQVQAFPNIGFDFARGLRAFLRQDPDIIMVGEVRDMETAEICVRSALAGRLVLSTLHTNDSVGSISRLLDLSVEPFLVSSTIIMIIAQRLGRRLCEKCKQPIKIDDKTSERYHLKGAQLFGPKGCDACMDRGYSGRIAVFEILCADLDIRALIEKRADSNVIRELLLKKGMKTLREDGIEKARQGLTSLDEILAITMDAE